jgi:short-subunit dehydrogenase
LHVAITGASSGIGEALVREFARRGAALTMVARRADRLEAIAREIGGRTHRTVADLADTARAADWIPAAEAALGPIDLLVNNAGAQIVGPTAALDWARAEELLRLNLHTPLKLTRTVLPAMLARRSGTIVDIASSAAFTALPGTYIYGASKGGLATASECLRGELRGSGVHVVTVYPGPVHTAMGDGTAAQFEPSFLKRLTVWGRADVLARLVADAVRRRRPRVIYPRFYQVQRWFPGLSRFVADRAPPLVPS